MRLEATAEADLTEELAQHLEDTYRESRSAGDTEEERDALREPVGQRVRIVGREQELALEDEELLDPRRVEGGGVRPRRPILLLPHGCGGM